MKKKQKIYTPKDIKFFCDYNRNIFNNIKEFKHYLTRKKISLRERIFAECGLGHRCLVCKCYDTDFVSTSQME